MDSLVIESVSHPCIKSQKNTHRSGGGVGAVECNDRIGEDVRLDGNITDTGLNRPDITLDGHRQSSGDDSKEGKDASELDHCGKDVQG
jgi:hypothetical protein